jgi:uncharacterized membrane protein
LLAPAVHAEPATTPRFELLGNPLNSPTAFLSEVSGISGDGSVIYGIVQAELVDPLRPEAGIQRATFAWRNGFPVQLARASGRSDIAKGASRNGRFIGGAAAEGGAAAVRWGLAAPEARLATPNPSVNPPATQDVVGISDDGRRAVGSFPYGSGSQDGAFAWSANTGYTTIPPIAGFRAGPEEGPGHILMGAADDARIALGYETKSFVDASNRFVYSAQAFYWTAETGTVGLGWASLNAVSPTSFVTDATPDGSVICGASNTQDDISRIGHIWTAQSGWERIVPGDFSSPALAISADGRTVVGWYAGSRTETGRAYIWTRDDGFNDLQTVLEAQGAVLPPGFTISEARGLSDDGRTIVGVGVDVEGRTVGWVATYSPQPGCPQVATQPAPVTVPAGQTAVLEAVFAGRTPQTIRWLRNGQPVSPGVGGAAPGGGLVLGHTSARLTILAAQTPDAGQYSCEIESICGILLTIPATLAVTQQTNCAVSIEPLRPAAATAGQPFTLSALVVGSGPLTFRWFCNDQLITDGPGGAAPGGGTVSGATTPTLRIDASSTADAGTYRYQVIGPCGTLNGAATPVLITAGAGCPSTPRAPEIVGTPTPGGFLTIAIGSLLGNGPFTFQWTRNGQPVTSGPQGASPGGGSVFIFGEPLNRLIIIGVQPSDSGVYACVISNACGTITTLPVPVTIGVPNPACSLADITGIGGPPAIPDGLLTGDDFNAFISAFAAGELLADVTGIGGPPAIPDGLITGDDFNAFISAFAAGCP